MSPRLPLVVMYHYVWPDERPVPGGIRPLMVSEFSAQLDWLEERYEIVSAPQFLERYREPAARPPCLLTFDDGTRDHAEVVTPLLADRALSGVFFIPTGPASRGLMPLTHALHWLLGQDAEGAWAAFCRYARENLPAGEAALGNPDDAARIYHYESASRARIKYAANMALAPEHTEVIIRALVESQRRRLADLAAEWFASSTQLADMHRAGMTLGMHGVTHRSLQALGAKGIRDEIIECSRYLGGLIGQPPGWWACPFGGSGASADVTNAMTAALESAGVRGAVTTRAAAVTPGTHPWSLPRIDAANLPPRTSRAPEGVE